MPESQAFAGGKEIESQLNDLSSRDVQLWLLVGLVITVLALGVITLVLPNLMWRSAPIEVNREFLPQFFSGFIVLVLLFNVYVFDQKRRLNRTRDLLVRQLISAQAGESLELVDSLTKVFGAAYVEAALSREAARAFRLGSTTTVLIADIAGFREINQKYGSLAGDHLLSVAAQTLRNTFRGSDTICRSGGDEFLVVMPDTTEAQAEHALRRLATAVQHWNTTMTLKYKLDFDLGIASLASPSRDHRSAVAAAKTRLNEAQVARRRGTGGRSVFGMLETLKRQVVSSAAMTIHS